AEQVDALVPDRHRLKCVVALLGPGGGPLALAARPEGMRQLGQGEDALPGIPSDLLLPEPAEQAEVVLPDRLVVAPPAELAHLAVVVQDQPRRACALRLLH